MYLRSSLYLVVGVLSAAVAAVQSQGVMSQPAGIPVEGEILHRVPEEPLGGSRYWNGLPTYETGSEFTNWRIANDFRVGETVIINAVDFIAFDTSNSNFNAWDGTIYWEIRNNTNDKPGFVIDSGEGVNITHTFDRTSNDWDFYFWSMDLGKDVQLPAETYWFVLKMNARCSERANFYWAEADGRSSRSQHYDHECLNRWVANDITSEHVFTLWGPGGGGELYSNGRPDYKGGVDFTGASQADDFLIDERSAVTAVRVGLLDADADNLQEWDGTGTWEIHEDANGLPGSSVASGNMINATSVVDRTTPIGEFREFTFVLDQYVCLDPGSYWLAIHLNEICFRTDLSWATSLAVVGTHVSAANCGKQWQLQTGELAFDVLGTDTCDVIYDNGRPIYVDGFDITGSKEADTFALDNRAKLESVEFSLIDLEWNDLAGWDRTGQWEIRSDANGAPGSILAEGAMANVEYEFDRSLRDLTVYDISFDFDEDLCLDAGTYWLSLHLNEVCQYMGPYWTIASDVDGSRHVQSGCSGEWISHEESFSFLIRGAIGCDCLSLDVEPLVADQSAEWRVSGADANSEVAIVYGNRPGQTIVNGFAGYCATFGIRGVNQSKVICSKRADNAGNMSCRKSIPSGARGTRVLSQAAQRGTCPNDECMSNIDEQVIQ